MAAELSEADNPLLRVIAYHRHRDDFMAMLSPPQEDALVRDSIVREFPTPPTASLGNLRGLPLELIMAILEWLPIASYFRFRQVNRLARKLASHRRYQSSTDNCMEALRAALRTRIGTYFTMADFYKATFTPECHVCGRFGNFMFLPLFKRCCWSCLEPPDKLPLVTVAALSSRYAISAPELLQVLPTAHALVRRAYPLQRIRRSVLKCHWASRELARDVLQKLGIKLKPGEKEPSGGGIKYERHLLATAFPYVDRDRNLQERGLSCRGCLFVELYPEKYNQDNLHRHQVDRAYTRKGFLEHFESCPPAQDLWERSHEGTVELEDEPLWLRNGGYPDLTYSNWAEPDAVRPEGRRIRIRRAMVQPCRIPGGAARFSAE